MQLTEETLEALGAVRVDPAGTRWTLGGVVTIRRHTHGGADWWVGWGEVEKPHPVYCLADVVRAAYRLGEAGGERRARAEVARTLRGLMGGEEAR